MTEVTLPWPPSELSPNSRKHWRTKAKVAREYRRACYYAAKEAGLDLMELPDAGRIHLWLDFYPPNRIRRDDDNLLAAFKAGRDGLADALGIDDRRFISHPMLREEIGGMVRVRLAGGDEG